MHDKWKKQVLGPYSTAYERHPYGILVLNRILVQRIEGELSRSRKNYSQLLKELSSHNFLKSCIAFLTRITSFRMTYRDSAVLGIPRFPSLHNSFVTLLSEKGFNIILPTHSGTIQRTFHRRMFVSSEFALAKILQKYSYETLDELILNEQDMEKLDKEVEKRVLRISKYLNHSNVKIIIITDVLNLRNALISKAAAMADIPCYLIPHGYPQTRFYHPFAVSNYVLAWNAYQREWISRFVNPKHILVIGYPKYDRKSISHEIEQDTTNRVLTLVTQPQTADERRLLYESIKPFSSLGYTIQVRVHPKEWKPDQIDAMKALIAEYGYSLSSESSMVKDILRSSLVIGIRSSVLYEATLIGHNSIQLVREGETPYYHEIPSLYMHDIPKLKDEDIANLLKSSAGEDLVEDFSGILNSLMPRLLSPETAGVKE